MIEVTLDRESKIAMLEPSGPLSKQDFAAAASQVDPFIEETGKLNGLIIHTESFPGWDSFAGFSSHLRFVKEHHKQVSHIALVTNSVIGNLGEHIATHFVSADIKTFAFDELNEAKQWILS